MKEIVVNVVEENGEGLRGGVGRVLGRYKKMADVRESEGNGCQYR